MLGSSRDVAVGTIAVASLLIPSMLGKEINPVDHQEEYISLVFTATFFSGVLQAALGFLRLGFIVDLLSHATIVGFMGGAATIVCLQQLKGMLGLVHFTHHTDIISVMHAVFSQTHKWRWESALLGCCFLSFLLLTRYYSKRKGAFFWINAIAPLTSVILGSLLVYFTHAEKHGVQVIGHLKRGLNPLSLDKLAFRSPHLMMAFKIGAITGIIVLAEGVAVGRSFAVFKNYHIDGNKEMIAFGLMNIVGSFTSCYLTSGPFSRTAVNFNAGCRTAVSNIVMSMAVMITLLLLTPFFYYTPLVVLAAIIISAMVGLINYEAAFHLFKVDKFDFIICIGAYLGVVFGSIEIGLVNAVTLSLIRLLLVLARPKTVTLGNIPNTMTYSNTEQYPLAERVRGVLILQINSSIYFTSENYLRERILRWVYEEEERIRSSGETSLQYLILDMGAVASIDTSGIRMLEEVKRTMDMKDLKLALANPGSEVMKKLYKSNFIEAIGQDWIYPTVAEAADACSFALPTSKRNSMGEDRTTQQENV
ncbi:Sulfate transporter 3.1 [Dionaea muscipula]